MVSFVESPWAVIATVAEQVINVAGGSKVSAVASEQERANHSHHSRVRCNSAIRLCYSLQLLPVVNEKHDLRGVVPPSPPTQAESLKFTTMHSRRNKTSSLSSSSPLSDEKDHQNHLHHRLHSSQAAGEGRSIFWVPLVFALSSYVLYLLSLGFTDEDTLESHDLKFPTNMEELSEMARFLSHFKDKHWERVLVLFIAAYVYKQTFAIPGSVFLNVLSGALFGPWKGFALTALLSGIGATLCYSLSRTFGRAYVVRWFPDKVSLFQEKIEENRDSLFFFLLFLRLFPMSPNWAMNIVAPIVGIPIHLFFFSVFIGLMPYTFVCAQTGAVLSQVSSVGDIFSTQTMLSMLLAALVALLPGLVINRMHVKRSQDLSR
ncbi:transmembrane protein 41a [Plakobranchus ocellatus]|uniref:Transmembrane protein 41a n=1 Tax=Plakobranchus ocellatus TaxID=259542 RepID=A0AAV4CL66_9GAST|nr:transmembrane protein 41a [Plakobranchus ocellatus]